MPTRPHVPRPLVPSRAPRVFVVDDSHAFRSAVDAVVRAAGCQPAGWTASASDAVRVLRAGRADDRPDLVLVDVRLPDASGTDLAAVLTRELGLRVALMSTLAEGDLPAGPSACGAVAFVPKALLGPAIVRALAGAGDADRGGACTTTDPRVAPP